MMQGKTAIVLFSDDFRINDNPALYNACQNYQNIIPMYIYQEDYLGRKLGTASKVFLHNVLNSFDKLLLTQFNIRLIIQKGDSIEVLKETLKKTRFDAIYFNESYTLNQIENEDKIKNYFNHLDVRCFKAKLLFHPSEIKPSSKTGSTSTINGVNAANHKFYKVFTPFAKQCLKNTHLIEEIYEKPQKINSVHNIKGVEVLQLNLIPKKQGLWHEKLITHWTFSFDEIENNFINFLENKLKFYKENRNIPSNKGTANISAYLRFGILSPKICFNAVMLAIANQCLNETENNQFVFELLWREFAYHVMFFNQNIANQELRPEYKNFQWNDSQDFLSKFLSKWQKGQTGFDIVDAGMNELWHTGVMHNRIRMVVASFLTKDLLINWRHGEQWFWDTLVDADPAVNPFSWQWVFGSGFDAAPYFRIFNPTSQKQKFDNNNLYCKKWLNSNWKADMIVNHDIQRKIALERYKNL